MRIWTRTVKVLRFFDIVRVILNFKHSREDEMSCSILWQISHVAPFVNKKKLVGVRLHKKGEPFEISVDEEAEGGEISSVRITSEQWTIVEYELIEPYLLGSTYFELSFSVWGSKWIVSFLNNQESYTHWYYKNSTCFVFFYILKNEKRVSNFAIPFFKYPW